MTTDKNQSNTRQTDQQVTEQVSNSNTPQYRPNWIIPDRETHSSDSNRSEDQQRNQQDNSGSSTGNEETLGIP
ncbi:hypothetical protein [Flavisolibacter tropicus]|uniref:Uncharacterized protein n=1 Tax=Flavisolibacter tropicus TaxID=1492898 RepID=A0A172U055_9BACT|nr:hypothetical protein [Flavisolibacter tropicus]ANE52735.1 hypothetical protein SY85_21925 [Flavisolibacter tropicus]